MTISGLAGIPLTRPAATLSPSDGERDGVRGVSSIPPLLFGHWYKNHAGARWKHPSAAEGREGAKRQNKPNPMDSLWTPYGLPMDSLWTSYGTTPSQHRALPRPSPGLQPQYGLMPTGVLTVGSLGQGGLGGHRDCRTA